MFGRLKRKEGLIAELPPQDWLSAAQHHAEFTPDIAKLEQSVHQLLFVCDELQRYHREHPKLGEDLVFCATAFTQGKYTLWKKALGKASTAILMDREYQGLMATRIKGELFGVRSTHFIDLDRYKVNGVYFTRRRISLDIPFRQVYWQKDGPGGGGVFTTVKKVHKLSAWAYVGAQDYWDEQIDNGYLFKPCHLYNPKASFEDSYYCFTTLEYNRDTEGIQPRLR